MPNVSDSTGTRSSTPWNRAAKSSSGGNRSGMNPKQRMPRRAKCLASVPPESMYGTMRASGSTVSNEAFMASTRSPSNVVSYAGRDVIHSRSTSGPMSSSIVASNSARRPGSTRQSTVASAVPGMTLAL